VIIKPGKHPAKCNPVGFDPGKKAIENFRFHLREQDIIQGSGRADGSHSAGVGAEVAVERPLVVAAVRQEEPGPPIDERMKRAFHTLQKFFDDNRASCISKNAGIHAAVDCLGRFSRVLRDDDSLAESQAVRLDHERILRRAAPRMSLQAVGEFLIARRRNPMALHEILCEGFRGFEACGGRFRAEDLQAFCIEGIRNPGGQRSHPARRLSARCRGIWQRRQGRGSR